MAFNPEDNANFAPHCRNCHKGSTACALCHADSVNTMWDDGMFPGPSTIGRGYTSNETTASVNAYGKSTYNLSMLADGTGNPIAMNDGLINDGNTTAWFQNSRTVTWDTDWRTDPGTVGAGINNTCSDDGFNWPHRTLGWKMLKDDLFGVDFDGSIVPVGETRTYGTTDIAPAHDLDSVCLDCHNPTIWNATSNSHTDGAGTADDYNDELLLRGLP